MTNDYFNNNTEGCEKLKSENFSCCLKKKVKTGQKEEREGGAKPSVRGIERAPRSDAAGAQDAVGRRREERSASRRELLRRKAQEASPRRQLFRSALGSSSGRAGS